MKIEAYYVILSEINYVTYISVMFSPNRFLGSIKIPDWFCCIFIKLTLQSARQNGLLHKDELNMNRLKIQKLTTVIWHPKIYTLLFVLTKVCQQLFWDCI